MHGVGFLSGIVFYRRYLDIISHTVSLINVCFLSNDLKILYLPNDLISVNYVCQLKVLSSHKRGGSLKSNINR